MQMQFDRVLALFKFGHRDHIDLFVREGQIYMNSLNYFKRLEGDILRTDKHECASFCEQADGAKLSMEENGNWLEIGTISGPIVSSDNGDSITNVFCMYAFRESASKSLVDERNLNFGDTFAILTDGDEFLRRVHA